MLLLIKNVMIFVKVSKRSRVEIVQKMNQRMVELLRTIPNLKKDEDINIHQLIEQTVQKVTKEPSGLGAIAVLGVVPYKNWESNVLVSLES